MCWFIPGVLILCLAAWSFWWAWFERSKKMELIHTSTSPIQVLLDTHRRVLESVGGEILYQRCEVKGTIEAAEPLEGPVSGEPCVAYHFVLERGNHSAGYEQTRDEERRIKFFVRDATGRIMVDPELARLELSRPKRQYRGQYRRTEEALKVGQRVYIIGWLGDFHGEPVIAGKPGASLQSFLITWKSEGRVIRDLFSEMQYSISFGVACAIIGGVLVAVGVIFW